MQRHLRNFCFQIPYFCFFYFNNLHVFDYNFVVNFSDYCDFLFDNEEITFNTYFYTEFWIVLLYFKCFSSSASFGTVFTVTKFANYYANFDLNFYWFYKIKNHFCNHNCRHKRHNDFLMFFLNHFYLISYVEIDLVHNHQIVTQNVNFLRQANTFMLRIQSISFINYANDLFNVHEQRQVHHDFDVDIVKHRVNHHRMCVDLTCVYWIFHKIELEDQISNNKEVRVCYAFQIIKEDNLHYWVSIWISYTLT